MSFARLIVRLLSTFAILSLFGCAVVSETRTVKNSDGSTTTTDSTRLEYRPTYSYYAPSVIVGPVAPVYPAYVGRPTSYGLWIPAIWVNGSWACDRRHARLIGRRCYY